VEIKNMPIAEIKPYAKNAKKHPGTQVAHIANSIREFDFTQPLVIDENGVLIIGHGRLLAAKSAGIENVPCYQVTGWSEEKKKAARLADNKTNESEWEFDLLNKELGSIFEFDMSNFGFDMPTDEDVDLEHKELKSYRKVHYLISLDINDNDKIISLIDELRNVGCEVESTLN